MSVNSTTQDKLYTVSIPDIASATQHRIALECQKITRHLLKKNQSYGSSMMMPGRLFSQATALERMDMMIDTTLSQLGETSEGPTKRELIQKLIGWLIIRQLASDEAERP